MRWILVKYSSVHESDILGPKKFIMQVLGNLLYHCFSFLTLYSSTCAYMQNRAHRYMHINTLYTYNVHTHYIYTHTHFISTVTEPK